MKLGTENRKELIAAGVLGGVLLLIVVYQFMPSASTIASTAPATSATEPLTLPAARPAAHHGSAPVKKERPGQNLDPTLQLKLLAATEAIKYEGSGRNIFISQAEAVVIPTVLGQAATDQKPADKTYSSTCSSAGGANSAEIFRVREPARRTQKGFPHQG